MRLICAAARRSGRRPAGLPSASGRRSSRAAARRGRRSCRRRPRRRRAAAPARPPRRPTARGRRAAGGRRRRASSRAAGRRSRRGCSSSTQALTSSSSWPPAPRGRTDASATPRSSSSQTPSVRDSSICVQSGAPQVWPRWPRQSTLPAALADAHRPAHAAELLVAVDRGGAGGDLVAADLGRRRERLEGQLEAAAVAVVRDGPALQRLDQLGGRVAGLDARPVERRGLDGAGGGDVDDLAVVEQQHDRASRAAGRPPRARSGRCRRGRSRRRRRRT